MQHPCNTRSLLHSGKGYWGSPHPVIGIRAGPTSMAGDAKGAKWHRAAAHFEPTHTGCGRQTSRSLLALASPARPSPSSSIVIGSGTRATWMSAG